MADAEFDEDAPFLGQRFRAAAVICRTEMGNLHAGVLHRVDDASAAVLNLGWEDQLKYEWRWRKLWAAPNVEPELLVGVAAMCRLIWEEFTTTRRFPYGLKYSGTTFDNAGRLKLGDGAKGLTCATFIVAVFESVGVKLVDENDWPVRPEDDHKYLEFVTRFATPEHLTLLRREVEEGCKRIQPQEVVGACACVLPAKFQPSFEAGKKVVEKLDGRPPSGGGRAAGAAAPTQSPPGALDSS